MVLRQRLMGPPPARSFAQSVLPSEHATVPKGTVVYTPAGTSRG